MSEDAPPYDVDRGLSVLRAMLNRRVTEKAWQQVILDAARLLNWSCYHTYDSRRSAPGFPDLCCAKPGRVLFIECKTSAGKTTPHQDHWLSLLGSASGNVRAFVARPDDWDWVERVLKGET